MCFGSVVSNETGKKMTEASAKMETGRELRGPTTTARLTELPGIHDDRVARRAGFRAAFIPFSYHFAALNDMLLDYFGHRWLTDGEIEISVVSPLFDGDSYTPRGKVKGEEPEGSGRLAVDIWGQNQDGKTLAVGTARC